MNRFNELSRGPSPTGAICRLAVKITQLTHSSHTINPFPRGARYGFVDPVAGVACRLRDHGGYGVVRNR